MKQKSNSKPSIFFSTVYWLKLYRTEISGWLSFIYNPFNNGKVFYPCDIHRKTCCTALFSMMCIHALSHHQSHAQSNHHANIIHPNLTNKEFECPTNECPPYVPQKNNKNPTKQTPSVFCLGLFESVTPGHPFFPHL